MNNGHSAHEAIEALERGAEVYHYDPTRPGEDCWQCLRLLNGCLCHKPYTEGCALILSAKTDDGYAIEDCEGGEGDERCEFCRGWFGTREEQPRGELVWFELFYDQMGQFVARVPVVDRLGNPHQVKVNAEQIAFAEIAGFEPIRFVRKREDGKYDVMDEPVEPEPWGWAAEKGLNIRNLEAELKDERRGYVTADWVVMRRV